MSMLWKRVAKAAAVALCDLLCIGGAYAIAYGAWRVYEPAGFIVGGLFALAAGLLMGVRLERAS